MKELTNWEQWQLERFGNILEVPDIEIEEPGEKEAKRFSEWTQLQRERELKEYE